MVDNVALVWSSVASFGVRQLNLGYSLQGDRGLHTDHDPHFPHIDLDSMSDSEGLLHRRRQLEFASWHFAEGTEEQLQQVFPQPSELPWL